MSYHVQRTRTQDTSETRAFLGQLKPAGEVAYSKTFRTLAAAQREADAWNEEPTDWKAIVCEGKAPRITREVSR